MRKNKPDLIILCGIPFAGKSTFANYLSAKRGYRLIDLDEIKFRLFGEAITDQELHRSDWDLIYQSMYQELEDALKASLSVIHDAGNFTRHERSLVSRIASNMHRTYITIYINTPVQVALKRLHLNRISNNRFDISDEAFHNAVHEMEPPISTEHTLIFDPTWESMEAFLSSNAL